MSTKPTLIIHGATSFTAKELLRYLDSHPDKDGFNFVLAGRSRAKLEKLNERFEKPREVVVVDLEDAGSVKRMMEKGDVVLNLAGPYRWYNAEAIIKECAETGKHYLDLTGEKAWVSRDIIPKYDAIVAKTGACIVPSCGFDSVPSDIMMYSALSKLQASYPHLSITKSTAMWSMEGTFSGGTIASFYAKTELPKEYREAKYNDDWAMTPESGPNPLPRPIITLSHPLLPFPTQRGCFFIMQPYNLAIIRRSGYLSRLAEAIRSPSDSQELEVKDEPKYGRDLAYEEGISTGGSRVLAAGISGALLIIAGLFNYSSIFRKVVKYFAPQQGSGATDEQIAKGFLNISSLSLTSDPNVSVLTTYVGKGDPGYVHTCHLLAECALSLVLPPPKGTALPPLAKRGGCLTPATAMGQVLIARMQISGSSVTSELLLGADQEGKKGV